LPSRNVINILKRLDGDQLARLEGALADLNHAARRDAD